MTRGPVAFYKASLGEEVFTRSTTHRVYTHAVILRDDDNGACALMGFCTSSTLASKLAASSSAAVRRWAAEFDKAPHARHFVRKFIIRSGSPKFSAHVVEASRCDRPRKARAPALAAAAEAAPVLTTVTLQVPLSLQVLHGAIGSLQGALDDGGFVDVDDPVVVLWKAIAAAVRLPVELTPPQERALDDIGGGPTPYTKRGKGFAVSNWRRCADRLCGAGLAVRRSNGYELTPEGTALRADLRARAAG